MNISYLILAITILIVTFLIQKSYNYNLKKSISTFLIGMFLSLTVLIFPLAEGSNTLSKLVYSIIYSAQTILIGEDVSLVNKIEIASLLSSIYITLIYVLMLSMPMLTISFILTLLNGITSKLRLKFITKKEVLVFSNLNEKSSTLAQNLKNKNAIFVFTNHKEDENINIKNIKSIKLKEDIYDIEISPKNKNITFYILSDNEDENLEKTLKLIEKYSSYQVKIYLITNNNMISTILDSTDKGKIRLEIVNETERAICTLLEEKPLYLKAKENHISALIVGCGNVGLEFLKTATWLGQIPGYDIEITVLDKCAGKIKQNIALEYPELLDNYHYNFLEADIFDIKAIQALDKIKNINYVLIALTNETDSLKAAINLRRHFLNIDFNNIPIINVWIENPLKNKQINNLKNPKNSSYDINAFGSYRQMYLTKPIINSKIENMAKQVHLAYDPSDQNLDNFYKKDYNVRSSRAYAMHIKYKMYAILKEEYQEDESLTLFTKTLENEEILNTLIVNEHQRWMAYMRTCGYKKATLSQITQYQKIINSHIHSLARLHPALVDYECLAKLEKQINVPLLDKDKYIIKKIPEIVKGGQNGL